MDFEKYSLTRPRRFSRLFARLIDYTFFYAIVTVGFYLAPILVPELLFFLFLFFLPLCWIPFEILFTKWFGTTPGKALLGIHLRDKGQNKPSLRIAAKRAWQVFVRGMGLGLPVLNLICLGKFLLTMKRKGHASWDTDLDVYVAKKRVARTVSAFLVTLMLLVPIAYDDLQEMILDKPLFSKIVGQRELDPGVEISWKNFKSPDGEFTINFPQKKPDHETTDFPIPGSENSLPFDEFKCQHVEDVHYSVSYTTLPRKWLKWSSGLVLKGSIKYISKHINHAKVIYRSVGKYHRLPSLDYILSDGSTERAGRLILVDNKLYKVEINYPASQRENIQDNLSEFVNSFIAKN